MDKILIKDLRVRGVIGIYDFERTTPQEILINICIATDTRRAAQTDDINECVNYHTIAERVKTHAETSKRLTVEALAEDIAQICLGMPRVSAVTIRVEKPQAIAYTASVGVEITRENVGA